MSATSSECGDYEHWPDDSKSSYSSSVAASGYNSRNGLRVQTYQPANVVEKKDEPKKEESAPAPAPAAPQPIAYNYPIPVQAQSQPIQYVMAYGPNGYGPYPIMNQCANMAYPGPAYYGYAMPVQQAASPAAAPVAAVEEKPKPKKEVRKWQGRTKAEVEEDNQKIARREGAWEARKVEPVGVKADQQVWVVEVGGEMGLRAYADVKEMKGEWKEDPRFRSWYFVREREEKD